MVQSPYRRKQSVCTWIRCSSNDNIKEEENRERFSLLFLSYHRRTFFVLSTERMGLHVFSFISSRSYMSCRYVMAIVYSFSLTGQCLLRTRMGARLSCWITYCVFSFFVRFSSFSFLSFFRSFFLLPFSFLSFFFFIICVVTTMYEYACMVVTAAAAATIARFCYWAVIQQRWREKKVGTRTNKWEEEKRPVCAAATAVLLHLFYINQHPRDASFVRRRKWTRLALSIDRTIKYSIIDFLSILFALHIPMKKRLALPAKHRHHKPLDI